LKGESGKLLSQPTGAEPVSRYWRAGTSTAPTARRDITAFGILLIKDDVK